jgi:hypothetical protein
MTRKLKPCSICTNLYKPEGNCSKYCINCKPNAIKNRGKLAMRMYRTNNGKPFGVGKGGRNKLASEDNQYKTGIRFFMRYRHTMRKEIRYCQRCSEDLETAKLGYWCVHHKDYDRTNNKIDNFELLCKKCHQIEHHGLKSN